MILAAAADASADRWLHWIESSSIAAAVRESTWGYPAIETAHILGFTMLVGAAALFDLRLLGFARRIPVADAAKHLLRCSRWSVLAVVPTGLLLFMTQATETWANPAFRVKLLLIAAAGLNALVFQTWTFRSVNSWNLEQATPLRAKLAGLVSLLCWSGVITFGRLIAYV